MPKFGCQVIVKGKQIKPTLSYRKQALIKGVSF